MIALILDLCQSLHVNITSTCILLLHNIVIMCPPLPDNDNGVVDWSGLSPGGVATYTCDPGFILVGDPTRICRDNGTWSGEEPTCERKLLSPLHVYCCTIYTYCNSRNRLAN